MFEYEIRNGVTQKDSILLLGYRINLIHYSRTEYGRWTPRLFAKGAKKGSSIKQPPGKVKSEITYKPEVMTPSGQ